MALIRTLTISTTTFQRMKGKFDGFQQTVKLDFSRQRFQQVVQKNPRITKSTEKRKRLPEKESYQLGDLSGKSFKIA